MFIWFLSFSFIRTYISFLADFSYNFQASVLLLDAITALMCPLRIFKTIYFYSLRNLVHGVYLFSVKKIFTIPINLLKKL